MIRAVGSPRTVRGRASGGAGVQPVSRQVFLALSLPSMWIDEAILLREAASDPYSRYLKKVAKILAANGKFEEGQIRTLFEQLGQVRTNLLAQIAALPTQQDGSFSSLYLPQLLAAVETARADLQTRFGTVLNRSVETAWQMGSDSTDDLLSLTWDGSLPVGVSTDQLLIAQQVAADLVRDVSEDFRKRARGAIQMGMLGNQPAFTTMQQVAALLATQTSRTNPKLGPVAYQAERIVRTETNGVYSLAAQLRQQQAVDEAMPDARKSWITAHDVRVRPAHVVAGNMYGQGGDPGPIAFDQPYMVGGEPMQHPHDPRSSPRNRINCRCISVLYRQDWFS
jgi:hypothetical protein